MVSTMLNQAQFQTAIAAAKQRFGLLTRKYPELLQPERPGLNPYLVLTLDGKQTGIGSAPDHILKECSAMVVDDVARASALRLLSRLKGAAATDSEKRDLRREFEELAAQFKYDETCQVELRFKEVNYGLIWKLQADELVDRNLTPQTKASIRIVLGTLAQFAETANDQQ
jgi:hypothetical protein